MRNNGRARTRNRPGIDADFKGDQGGVYVTTKTTPIPGGVHASKRVLSAHTSHGAGCALVSGPSCGRRPLRMVYHPHARFHIA